MPDPDRARRAAAGLPPEWRSWPPGRVLRNGGHAARRLRHVRRIPAGTPGLRAVDLAPLLVRDGLEEHVLDGALGHYAVALLRDRGRPGGAIVRPPSASGAGVRFAIAHALGHYHIPRHADGRCQFICTTQDVLQGLAPVSITAHAWALAAEGTVDPARRDAAPVDAGPRDAAFAREVGYHADEWDANAFAADLLMPPSPLATDMQGAEVSFGTVHRIAAAYAVPALVAAWRVVQLSTAACALVVLERGVVRLAVRSATCPMLRVMNHGPIAPTLAEAVHARGAANHTAVAVVPAADWLVEPEQLRGPLVESTVREHRTDRVTALLWMPHDWQRRA